ncbi:MAG: alanine racemase [Kribbellaceae bacterium]
MPLTLRVDAARWRQHLHDTWTDQLVPVAKGNGYGFGRDRLLAEAGDLGARTVAVGIYEEVPAAPDADVVVLSPWRPFLDVPESDRVIHTVSRAEDLRAIPAGSRVVVELQTSMLRHGILADRMPEIASRGTLDRVRFEGWSIHLPMDTGDNVREATELGQAARAVRPGTLWVSHVRTGDLASIGEDVRLRLGTALWLGDRLALDVRATVLDVHPVRRGERVGYRQRRCPADGHLLVVSGGTAHGIGMEAPTAAANVRQRAVTLAKGGLDAAGRALSPYTVGGKQRWFVEPPHMQASMLFLPSSVKAPVVGDEIGVDVRFTTTTFDRVILR